MSDNAIVCGIMIVFCIGIAVGYSIGQHRTHVNAVKSGVGEFYMSDKLSQTAEFRWITNNNKN